MSKRTNVVSREEKDRGRESRWGLEQRKQGGKGLTGRNKFVKNAFDIISRRGFRFDLVPIRDIEILLETPGSEGVLLL